MLRFYLQWSKVVQFAADSNEGNQKLKHIQNYDKRLDMEKHPFILIITVQFISYFIHYDCGLLLRTHNFLSHSDSKCPILSGNLNHCCCPLIKSGKCTLDNSKYTRYNILHLKDWSALCGLLRKHEL